MIGDSVHVEIRSSLSGRGTVGGGGGGGGGWGGIESSF